MGFALAEECARRGATVTLIAGPVALKTVHPHIYRIDVESCEEMYQAAVTYFPETDVAILCAAVADFKPAQIAPQKIKREKDELTIRLQPTHDIAAALGKMKKGGQHLVGFALETNDEQQNALSKLKRKNLDFIVLNSLRNEGTCFQSDENQITILSNTGRKDFEKKDKGLVAKDIINEVEQMI
jgi:phosphopantothenoylcysteine decarboxylase/phosphopantothenate--cysteine ligase